MGKAKGFLEIKHISSGGGAHFKAGNTGTGNSFYFRGSSRALSATTASFVFDGVLNNGVVIPNASTLAIFSTGRHSKVVFRGSGEIWSYGHSAIHPFDDEDDNELLRGYSLSKMNPIKENWNQFVHKNINRLEELDIIDGDMVNMNGMMELQTGAIWQINSRLTAIEELSIIDMIKILFARVLHLS